METQWEQGLAIMLEKDPDRFYSLYAKGAFKVSEGSVNSEFYNEVIGFADCKKGEKGESCAS